jgi:hypothetical protein
MIFALLECFRVRQTRLSDLSFLIFFTSCFGKGLAWQLRRFYFERNSERRRKMQKQKIRRRVIQAMLLSGAVGMVSPVWSQEAPGEMHQPYPNLTRPGRGEESIPGIHQGGTPELSKTDMRAVEEALKAKGYNVGRVDGVADDNAREAIRSFQFDNGLPITGMVDQRTADKLDVRISEFGGSQSEQWNSRDNGRSSNMTKPGDDQSLPSHFRN